MKRVKYVSRFAGELGRAEIDDLVARAAAKNARLDVTGILMTSGQMFFQVLEGPGAHVDQIYQGIVADERHRDVLLLESETDITERFFPGWSMRKVDLDDASLERLAPAREMLVRIIEKRREVARLTHELERAIWRELASTLD